MKTDYSYEIGIDIGGTFTDFSVLRNDGELFSLKVPSVPKDPIQALRQGLGILINKKIIDPLAVRYFSHGTTIGVNTLIQQNGARLCLFCTEGFADILQIQRLRLADSYNLFETRPVPLIPRDRVIPIQERARSDGSILIPLDKSTVTRAIERAIKKGAEGIVVSFLHSYKNPQHERLVKEMVLEQAPQVFVCCASEIWPEIREYERTMVAVINSYVQPKMKNYLDSLEHLLHEMNINKLTPYVTKSNGGVMTAKRGKIKCAEMLQSGPAAGVAGAVFISKLVGFKNIFTLDVGGTSADVAMVTAEQIHYSKEEDVMGFPMIIPQVRVSSIGAGGGSVAWADSVGLLKVGPESMGADPGPACYNLGGTKPTVTDAFMVCGLIQPETFAGGIIKLYPELSKEAIENLGRRLNLGLIEAAQAIIEVVTANMYAELRRVSSKEGVDPGDYALVPFGGGGPLVACFLAEEMKMTKILIPASPGTLSSLGNIVTDVKSDLVKSVTLRLSEIKDHLKEPIQELKREALKWLAEEGPSVTTSTFQLSADMRYVGQSFEIEVPLEESWISGDNLHLIANAFHQAHEKVYGHSDMTSPAELVSLRATIFGKMTKPQLRKIAKASGELRPKDIKTIYYNRETHSAALYSRQDLHCGHSLCGPAIIEGADSTILVTDGFTGVVDSYGNIILEKEGGY